MFAAVLDTCVLFSNSLRDTLLTLAETELFRPLWSSMILSELRRTICAKRAVDPAALDRTIAHMSAAFRHAEVRGWEPLVL